MFLAIGMCKCWSLALNCRTEDVNPCRKRHVEWRRTVLVGEIGDQSGELQLLNKRNCRLKVLMPWDVWKRIVNAAHRTLEENHAQRCLEDLLMFFVAIQSGAELGNGCISMAHDVVVHLLTLDVPGGFVVLSGNAQTTVQVAFVAL